MLPPVSIFIPCFNCADTVAESVSSILDGNLGPADEIILVDDGSDESTKAVLEDLARHPQVRLFHHERNLGGGAARNTAVRSAKHDWLFCLDSDNLLEPASLPRLLKFAISNQVDAATFQRLSYFIEDSTKITHEWIYRSGPTCLADCLAGHIHPIASGNYLFSRESWRRAGGYPEKAGALDTWGFGLRQLATGTAMSIEPGGHYFHRHGHESYWVRDWASGHLPAIATKLLLPFADLLDTDSQKHVKNEGSPSWFEKLPSQPLRVAGQPIGKTGKVRHRGKYRFTHWYQRARSKLKFIGGALLRRVKILAK